jgi:hypothetical protein
MVVMPLGPPPFYTRNPKGASYFLLSNGSPPVGKTPAGHAKIPPPAIFSRRFRKSFRLDLEGAGPGVDFFGNVRPKCFFTAACFLF